MMYYKKSRFMKTLCILLSICFFGLNSVQAYASETSKAYGDVTQYQSLSLQKISQADLKAIYSDMTPEAKAIFVNYMQTSDSEMLALHKAYVDPNVAVTPQYQYKVASVAVANQLQTLSYQLDLIGLADSVKYALLSAGSSIVAALADGPLVVGDIIAILVGVGCAAVLIANWDSVSSNWDKIVDAFKVSFTGSISSTTMSNSFSDAKPSYSNPYQVMQELSVSIRTAPQTASFSKHIDRVVAGEIVKRQNPFSIYYSAITKKALFVYSIPNGTIANINQDFNSHSTWQLPNFNISGAKLFVIYDFGARAVIHAHLRLFRDDTESMRYGNKMSWQIRPYMSYDSKYEIGGGTTWLYGDIYTR